MGAQAISRAEWVAARARSAGAARRWRRTPEWRALAAAFDAAAAVDIGVAQARATALLGDAGWAERMLAPLVAALAGDPLFEPPFKVAREGGRIGAILFDAPAARVAASVLTPTNAAPPASVVVPGHVSVTRYVRAGGMLIRRWRVPPLAGDFDASAPPAVEIAPLAPADGDVVGHDGRIEGQVTVAAARDIVTLTIILRAGAAALMREYRVADGALVRAASTDDGASRAALLLTFLRVSGRSDSGDLFAAATRERAFHDRWSAMRQWLALDARAALPRLAEMAERDANAEVRAAATATLALACRRMAPCPA